MKDKTLVESDNEAITRKIGEALTRFKEIDFAYLFGSFLESDTFNDVDIALYLSKDLGPYKALKLSLVVERVMAKEIEPRCEFDVKILNHAPIVFQYEIIKTGKVVFSRDEKKRIMYEAMMLSSYLDYKETSDWLDREFLVRV